jgi:hypothetical protein
MNRSIMLSLPLLVSSASSSVAQTVYFDGVALWLRTVDGWLRIPMLFLVVSIAVLVAIYVVITSSGSSRESPEPAAARYDEETARLRALKRQTDAQTELTASLIHKARVDAEHKELSEITKHDREIRGLRRKL